MALPQTPRNTSIFIKRWGIGSSMVDDDADDTKTHRGYYPTAISLPTQFEYGTKTGQLEVTKDSPGPKKVIKPMGNSALVPSAASVIISRIAGKLIV
ncbi:MAG: hypothetical protein CL608_15890 [Anaerolineaceae bacterium]|nr:hypothetical protein [Anaerolineaceae bacterium]